MIDGPEYTRYMADIIVEYSFPSLVHIKALYISDIVTPINELIGFPPHENIKVLKLIVDGI